MPTNPGNITKKEIVEQIAERTGLTQVDTKVIVECFLDSIAKALAEQSYTVQLVRTCAAAISASTDSG